MVTEIEKYERLKLAISELELLELIIVEERYDPTARRDTDGRCRYVLSFGSNYRSLELTGELVRKALKENLGRIKESLRHWGRQWIGEQHKKALEEQTKLVEEIQRGSGG